MLLLIILLIVYNYYNHHILFYNLYTLSLITGVKINKVLSEDILKKLDVSFKFLPKKIREPFYNKYNFRVANI